MWELNRKGGAPTTIAGVIILVIILVVGGAMIEGSSSSQSGGTSPGNIEASLANGFSMLAGAVKSGGVAQVQTGPTGLISDTFTGNRTIPPTCSKNPFNSYLELLNVGKVNATATKVTISYAGETNSFDIAGSCIIGPSGSPTSTMYILFKGPSKLPSSNTPQAGLPYSGDVALSNGAHLPFTGKFYQGSPHLTVVESSFPTADFSQGKPGNATCSTTRPVRAPYVLVNNTGTVGMGFTSLSLDVNNTSVVFPIVGSCSVGPDGTAGAQIYVSLASPAQLQVTPKPGQPFSGKIVATPPSFSVSFSGKFQ